ncbi:coatomer subunit zeta-2 isoform X2 [Equus quagga]|uniref:coatomer subunit zeta-2 isoform X2 n=1 Tax=Equus quagga TaxID=89248 RepID=UPI001EE21330|nr:coatomer subunit zeta-2 isoform X2 [Equus quagga]
MQRPEAWPRPHPGEGAAAAQAGGPAPPAQAGEPAGLRLQEPSLYTIKAVFILDNDGHRLLAKYYDDTFPSMKEQMAFEKNVFNKTSRTDSEIAFFGGMTIVYKSSIDLFLYVVGSSHENELMLMSVLTCLFESLNHVLSACSGSGGERVEGEGLPHLGRDLAPPGHREAQELCLPSGRTWRSAGCWRTWTEPSWCWTRLWMAA